MKRSLITLTLITTLAFACTPAPQHDVVIRHGIVYDGTGAAPKVEDLGIDGDRVVARGDLSGAKGRQDVDATDLAVAPGFINMLSHSETSLIADGRSQGDIRQGVTPRIGGPRGSSTIEPRTNRDCTFEPRLAATIRSGAGEEPGEGRGRRPGRSD